MPGGLRDVWMKVTLVLEPLLRDLRGERILMLRDGFVVDREDLLEFILKMEIYCFSYHLPHDFAETSPHEIQPFPMPLSGIRTPF